MLDAVAQWPSWLMQLMLTVVTVGVAYGLGHLINAIVIRRLHYLAQRTRGEWDDLIIGEVRRRVPFWSVLVGIWLSLGHWALRPDLHTLATGILIALAGLSITLAAASLVGRLVVSYGPSVTPGVPVSRLMQNVARLIVLVLGLLVILNQLGVSITPMLTALGVGGLAVALALQEPLSNLFAGVFISLAGQVRIGDYVKLDSGVEGYVADLDWRSTRIRMLGNSLVIVPNAKLAQAIVTNYSRPDQELAVVVQVGVDYLSDLPRVERVAMDVAREVMREVPGGVPAFEPFVRFHTFSETRINFNVVLRARQFVDQYLITHEFIKRLHARFDEERIVIPFPIRAVPPEPPKRALPPSG